MVENRMIGIMSTFIILIVGVALLISLADTTTDVTEAKTVINESVTLVNATAVGLANNQLDSITSVINATNASESLTSGVNFTADLSAGTITLISAGEAGVWNVTYIHRQVGNSTARTLITLVILFFVLGLLGMTLAALSPSFRELMGFK
jgi:hypothetical protein